METDVILNWWENLRLVWAAAGLGLALTMGVALWRVRGLLNWKQSQRKELAELRRWRDQAENARGQAIGEIITGCENIWKTASPDLGQLAQLPAYWRKIAAAYHPRQPQPELCLSIGRLLAAAQQLAQGLEELLQRPGFDRLGRLRVRQLRRTHDWYLQLSGHPAVAWIMAHRRVLSPFRHTLRFVLPDPLAWIAYLSQRLTVMMTIRCLLMDVYLFTGKVALEAFDVQRESASETKSTEEVSQVLDAYEAMIDEDAGPMSTDLSALRSELVGFPARFLNPPDVKQWHEAVEKAARLIAKDYFPLSSTPLEEARLNVLLNRGRYWLQAMAEARRLPVVRPLYQVSLKRLMQIKALSESDLLRRTGKAASGAWAVWRWARWPVKVLRWARRGSPASVAMDVGFTLAGKAVLNFLARRGFDLACRDLDHVYRLSSSSSPFSAPVNTPPEEN